jgi:voltage-gated potassium channel
MAILLGYLTQISQETTNYSWTNGSVYLIVVNLFVLLFEHVPAVFEPNETWFHNFDIFSVIIFTVEYLLRLYVAPEDPEFADKKRIRGSLIFSVHSRSLTF